MKAGTLVKIKKDYLDTNEDPNTIYIVLEDREDRSAFMQLDTFTSDKLLKPWSEWFDYMVYKVGEVNL